MGASLWKAVKQTLHQFNPFTLPFRAAVARWFKADGDRTLRFDYPLNAQSVAIDLGGYHGDWTAGIYERFHCRCYIFEPVEAYYRKIEERFRGNPDVHAYHCGLSDHAFDQQIGIADNGSSVFKTNAETQETAHFLDATAFLEANGLDRVDVMKINIEGGEYALLESLIASGSIRRIRNLQVQFHRIRRCRSGGRMRRIQRALAETHVTTWKFRPYVWENWTLRTDGDPEGETTA